METATHASMRSTNQNAIIRTLFDKGEMSKAALAKILHMSKPAVSDNVQKLADYELVTLQGQGEAAKNGGRKPYLYKFNECFKYIVVIDFNTANPCFAIANLKYQVLERLFFNNAKKQEIGWLSYVKEVIYSLTQAVGCLPRNLGAIVISSPGIIFKNSKKFFSNPQFDYLSDTTVNHALAKEFGVRVIVKNDINLAALGEHTLGVGKPHANMVFIGCGLGLGAGIIMDGKLYEGTHCAAGEICYFTDSARFKNGENAESTVAIHSLLKRIRTDLKNKKIRSVLAAEPEIDNIQFEHFVSAVQKNDKYALSLVDFIGAELGIVVSNIATLLDVDLFIIGGEYSIFAGRLIKSITAVLKQQLLFVPKIFPASLGKDASLYGALVAGTDFVIQNLSL